MKAEMIIQKFYDCGGMIEIQNNALQLTKPTQIDLTELLSMIKQNKPDILRVLQCKQYGLTLEEVKITAAEDWGDMINQPEMFEAFLSALQEIKLRQQGIIPDDYDATAYCEGCQQIRSLPQSISNHGYVEGCPWCWGVIFPGV